MIAWSPDRWILNLINYYIFIFDFEFVFLKKRFLPEGSDVSRIHLHIETTDKEENPKTGSLLTVPGRVASSSGTGYNLEPLNFLLIKFK